MMIGKVMHGVGKKAQSTSGKDTIKPKKDSIIEKKKDSL
jgi:hypothetical protein